MSDWNHEIKWALKEINLEKEGDERLVLVCGRWEEVKPEKKMGESSQWTCLWKRTKLVECHRPQKRKPFQIRKRYSLVLSTVEEPKVKW